MDDELKHNLEAGFNKLFNSPIIIRKKKRDQALKKKALFISLVTQYEISLNKSVKLQTEFAIDLFDYEGSYYEVIDKLMLLMWGGDIYEIVTYYLYERLNLDGSLSFVLGTVTSIASPTCAKFTPLFDCTNEMNLELVKLISEEGVKVALENKFILLFNFE